MVRHGYPNCTACHFSPNGGGVLTEYGRELSRELLSTWSKEGEERFLYDQVKLPPWLSMGGDLRVLTIRQQAPSLWNNRTLLMQADLEAAIHYKSLAWVGTVGIRDSEIYPDDLWISRRHFLIFHWTDELALRAGRFFPAFGIYTPDHAISTRRDLGWDQGMETYNLEGSWLGESANLYFTGVFSRPEIPDATQEHGIAASGSYALSDRYKVGASYFYGTSDFLNRNVFGPFAILGFTEDLSLQTELDFFRNFASTAQDPTWGLVNYQKVDYSFFQGFHGYLTQQVTRADLNNEKSLRDAYGIGVQFFPRPHFELRLDWEKRRNVAVSQERLDWLYFTFHYYL